VVGTPGPAARREVRLFLCGDVMTGRGIDQVLPFSCPPRLNEHYVNSAATYVALAERFCGSIPRPLEYDRLWGDALPLMADADARIVNLETSITTCEDALPKGINYRMHPGNAALLTAAGIDCCVLANNHVLDWGEGGLLETLDTLRAAGIAVAGAGRTGEEAAAPAEIPIGAERRVLVYAMGLGDSGIPPDWAAGTAPGVHRLPDLSDAKAEGIAAAVRRTKRNGDIALASIHWGPNWGYRIEESHRRFAHALVERAGIDLVHGHSSHHPKGMEVHGDRLILYGCGDFLNDYEGIRGHRRFRPELVVMYLPTLAEDSGRLLGLEMVPLQLRGFTLRRASPVDVAWMGDTLDRECRRFGHRVQRGETSLRLLWR
jgi:poly-gamma-glutamate capsule biosynthesis protein CapA/YwtB (metallophosphatase superfamily)